MRLLIVNANKVALEVKRGRVRSVFTEGRYWIWFSRNIHIYDLNHPDGMGAHWNTYLQNDQL